MLMDAHLRKSNLTAPGLVGLDTRQHLALGLRAHGCESVGKHADSSPADVFRQTSPGRAGMAPADQRMPSHSWLQVAAPGLQLVQAGSCQKRHFIVPRYHGKHLWSAVDSKVCKTQGSGRELGQRGYVHKIAAPSALLV